MNLSANFILPQLSEAAWEDLREILLPPESAFQSREDKIAKAREFLEKSQSHKTGRIYKFRRQ